VLLIFRSSETDPLTGFITDFAGEMRLWEYDLVVENEVQLLAGGQQECLNRRDFGWLRKIASIVQGGQFNGVGYYVGKS